MWRLLLLSCLLLACSCSFAGSLLDDLIENPAQIDICGLFSEDKLRASTGWSGKYFSQSVDSAYRRLSGDNNQAPSFAGCWWRLTQASGDFIMLQLVLHPTEPDEAIRRIDAEIEASRAYDSPLMPEPVTGLGNKGFWSPLGRRVRWRHGDSVIVELLWAQQVIQDNEVKFNAEQLKQLSIDVSKIIDAAIKSEWP